MTTLPWPDWLEHLWAKSPQSKGGHRGESLAGHTWHTLERLRDVIRLRPGLPQEIDCPFLWNSVLWACWLHDFGKSVDGFQRMLRGAEPWRDRHEVLSLAFVDWLADEMTDEERRWLVAGIVSHHRDADEINRLYADPDDGDDDPLERLVREIGDEALDGLWRWTSECARSWVDALGLASVGVRVPVLPPRAEAVRLLKERGAIRIRYWLREYRRWVERMGRARVDGLILGTIALRGHIVSADHLASARTGELPDPGIARWPDLLGRLGLDWEGLYQHQRDGVRVRGSAMLVAPTGSGKTEAALLWACAQSETGRSVPRLFYMLPYQASMNAMFDRLQAKAFPDQVGLEHSRSTLALYRRLLAGDYTPQRAAALAKWEHNLARLSYYPVRVLSPYQILKGPYQLRGYEALLTDCFGGAFVLDEIHAYEANRLAMILATVRYLREQFGAVFFVMSATLPSLLTERLADALGEHTPIRASDELFALFRRHRLRVLPGELLEDESLEKIAREARAGRSILVCCNTVARAQHAYEELQARLPGIRVALLHGRFNGRDRLVKEQLVQRATGSKSKEREAIVLVATQVVEVSLDIDLDVIYTDPAPLEALIQRFGRVNRRRLKEWCPVHVFMEPRDGQGIYDKELVCRGLEVLTRHDDTLIDEAHIGDWLDAVYTGEVAARWQSEYDATYREFVGACLSTLRAFSANDSLEEAFYRAFDSIEVLPRSLDSEFRQLKEEEPLRAQELCVPVRWHQFARLRHKGKASMGSHGEPNVVDAPYDSDAGLML